MSKFEKCKESLKKLTDNGIAGVFLAGFVIFVIIALVVTLVVASSAVVMGLIWSASAAIIYYGLSLVGYAITYKTAFGSAMLLTVISGVIGGVKINNNVKPKS